MANAWNVIFLDHIMVINSLYQLLGPVKTLQFVASDDALVLKNRNIGRIDLNFILPLWRIGFLS